MLKKSLLAVVMAAAMLSQAQAATHAPQTLHLEVAKKNSLQHLIPKDAKLELITNQAKWSEGPLILKDGSIIWSDIVNNRVLKWNETEGVTTWLKPAQFQNGHAMDAEGRILAASHGKRAIERLEADGKWHVVVDLYEDKKLNSPNDLAIDRDGDIWFTDPTFGIKKKEEGYGGFAVAGGEFSYRYSTKDHTLTRLDTPDVKAPNGIAFSPDFKKLYLTDSQLAHDPKDPNLHRHLVSYDIDENKALSNGKMLAQIDTGIPDGVAVDEKGNIWVTGGEYIHVFKENGDKIGSLKFPSTVANLVFTTLANGQKVIYVTGSENLFRIPVLVSGVK